MLAREMCALIVLAATLLEACGVAGQGTSGRDSKLASEFRLSDSDSVTVSSISIRDGATKVAIDNSIHVQFSSDIDPSKIPKELVRLNRVEDGLPMDGDISYGVNELVFTPKLRFRVVDPYNPSAGITWDGMRPNTQYRFSVGGRESGIPEAEVTFSTVDLDYGLFWFGADGSLEKDSRTKSLRFFDPTKPTVIHLHGWQNGSSSSDMWRENPYLFAGKYIGAGNALQMWRDKGFNVGVFYWSQWADEEEATDAEAKVWRGQNLHETRDGKVANMRYRLRNQSYRELTTHQGVADVFTSLYASAMKNVSGGQVRLVGHSLGAQLAIVAAKRIAERVEAGEFSRSIVPTRITLLDGFWAKKPANYLEGRRPGDVCNEYLEDLISKYDVAVEQVKTSALGGAVGDENLDLRKMAAFYRVWPDFIPLSEQRSQHTYAYAWYMQTIASPVPSSDGGFLGAGASDADIKAHMNYWRKDMVHYETYGDGTKTPTPSDDLLRLRDGVRTW